MLLVGINYNKKTKAHECRIERITNGQQIELLSKGMIEMTHPENHNHRSQRYRLTDTGRKEIE